MSDRLRLEVLLAAVDKVTAPLKRIGAGARSLAGDVNVAEAALKKLESQQRALQAFKRSTEQLKATRTQLQAARQSHAELAAQTHAGAAAQKAHAAQMAAADAVVKRLSASFDRQATAARRARAVLESRGISNPAAAEAQLAGQIEKTTQALQRKQAAYQRMAAMEKARARMAIQGAAMTAGGVGAIAAGRRTVQAGLAPAASFMQHEDAMLGIARQVQGARDDAGNLTQVYRTAEAQVRELSTRIPQTTVQIAQMMTAAARMEVPTEELSKFTELASEMATAFDAVPDQLAESMGKVAKNFKWPITEIRGLADAINYLDDNAISKGSDIIDVLNRTGGVASTVKISAENAAALGSTLLTLGERAESAATAINAIFTKFAAATKGTKKFKAAVHEIGMTTESIQKGMSKDAAGTLLKVAEAIKQLPEDKRIGVMAELVGLEHSDTLAKLVDKPDELKRQMALANGSAAKGSMSREAAARNATLSAELQKQRNRVFNAMAVAGETLKAPLLELFKAINPLLEKFTAWMQANPALVGGILKAVVVVGVMSAALGAVLLPIGLLLLKGMLLRAMLGTLVSAFSGVFGLIAKAGPWLLRAGQWLGTGFALLRGGALLALNGLRLLAGFLLANPIVLLIAAMSTAAFLLWRNWDTVKGWLLGIWAELSSGVATWWASTAAGATALWESLVALKDKFFTAGADLMDGLSSGVISRITAVRDAISTVAGDAIDWFKQVLGIHSPSRVFMELGGYVGEGAALGIDRGAAGVRAAALGMAAAAIVPMGYPGMAMADAFPSAAALQPLAPLAMTGGGVPQGPAAGARSTYQITINAAPGMDEQAIARAVTAALERRDREAASRRYSRMDDID